MQKQKPKKASTKGQSHETVRNLKACIKNKELLRQNHRGLVPFFSQHFHKMNYTTIVKVVYGTVITKKVGIDTSKEDVLAVFRVLESDGSLPSIESVFTPYRQSLPSPLGLCGIVSWKEIGTTHYICSNVSKSSC